jgi:hypothetical protein
MEGVLLPILVGDLTLVKADGWCPPVIMELTRAGGTGEWGVLYWKESELAAELYVRISCGDMDDEEDKFNWGAIGDVASSC